MPKKTEGDFLIRCPFCDELPEQQEDCVRCPNCGATAPNKDCWNTRSYIYYFAPKMFNTLTVIKGLIKTSHIIPADCTPTIEQLVNELLTEMRDNKDDYYVPNM